MIRFNEKNLIITALLVINIMLVIIMVMAMVSIIQGKVARVLHQK